MGARLAERLRQPFWLGAVLFCLLVMLGGVAIWLASTDARREIDRLAVANADSGQWSLAQGEVEFLVLETALVRASQGAPEALAEVRRRFDVFYSRVDTLKNTPGFAGLLALPEPAQALDEIERFLAFAVPYVDGDDEELLLAVPAILAAADKVHGDLRTISLTGARVFAQRSEAQRGTVASALRDLGVIAGLQYLALLAFVAALIRLVFLSRRQTEEIRRTESRLASVVSTALEGIILVDEDGRLIDFNAAAEDIFGYTRDEAIGRDLAELIIPDRLRAAHAAGMRRYVDPGQGRMIRAGLLTLDARHKSGRVFPVELSLSTAQSGEGEIFVSFVRDISRRVAAETELGEARDRAVAGEKAKAQLLAVMSHEMRTPLNGVIGTLELLSETPLDETQRRYVDVMESSGRMLLEHVNTVLDMSRADAGKAEVVRRAFDPAELADEVVETLRAQAEAAGNSLSVQLLGAAAGPAVGDRARLRQVLINLVGNAIKFTENGRIDLEVERAPGSDSVEFRIIDSGIGIAEEDQDRIFDDFVTLDTSYQRQVEGTGLGLGIVRRLVALMGGEIGVESEPGEGSVFWLRLPLPPAASHPAPPLAAGEAAPDKAARGRTGLSVLVVEDNATNRMVVHDMLALRGCAVTEAHDGLVGVELARTQPFDLILMDVSMPRLDGTAAARLIREAGGPNARTPIVALTAHALPGDIERFRAAGMAGVLTKPLSGERLDAMIRGLGDSIPDGIGKSASDAAAEDALGQLRAALGPDMAGQVVERVRGELAAGLEELGRLAGTAGHHAEISALAHKLAGSAALVGFRELGGKLAELEAAGPRTDGARLEATVRDAKAILGTQA